MKELKINYEHRDGKVSDIMPIVESKNVSQDYKDRFLEAAITQKRNEAEFPKKAGKALLALGLGTGICFLAKGIADIVRSVKSKNRNSCDNDDAPERQKEVVPSLPEPQEIKPDLVDSFFDNYSTLEYNPSKDEIDMEAYDPGFLVDTPIKVGSIGLIAGDHEHGKSTVAVTILRCAGNGVSTGWYSQGTSYESRPIIYLDGENGRLDLEKMFKVSKMSNLTVVQGDYKDERSIVRKMLEVAEKQNRDFVICADNMSTLCSELHSDRVRKFVKALKKLIAHVYEQKGLRLTVIIVKHSIPGVKPGGKEIQGSQKWMDLFPVILKISKSEYGDDFKILRMVRGRSEKKKEPIIVQKVDGETGLSFVKDEVLTAKYQSAAHAKGDVPQITDASELHTYSDRVPDYVALEWERVNSLPENEGHIGYEKLAKQYNQDKPVQNHVNKQHVRQTIGNVRAAKKSA